jgi:hypothetical protein
MPKNLKSIAMRLVAVGAAACSSVYAARPTPEVVLQNGGALAPASPYTIELLDEAGRELDTFASGGRFYVLGAAGTRYSVRVTNPTDRRVEAVISIDGLDVIDGEDADFMAKRGYIVPPHDVLLVEGFRTSHSAVASFRFSSVADSYAERKGKGRNVGVVGVAIFEETADAAIIVGRADPISPPRHPVDRWLEHDQGVAPRTAGRGAPDSRRDNSAPRKAEAETRGGDDVGGGKDFAPSSPSEMPAAERRAAAADASSAPRSSGSTSRPGSSPTPDPYCCGQRTSRPGLGTAWGEQRWSAVSFTQFVRRNPARPDALAELRYNDADGLAALGILIKPAYDEGEVARRETADPFPATRFAQPAP